MAIGKTRILMAKELGVILGWSTKRAQRWLESTGAGVKRGGRWITTPARLAEKFPEALESLTLHEIGEDED